MANHKSAIKRIRSSEVKKQRNRYQHKTARTAMKKFFEITKKKEAEKELPISFEIKESRSKFDQIIPSGLDLNRNNKVRN